MVLDSGALVLYFPSPRTVTGEDILELHVHGGNAIVKAILGAIPQCAPSSSLLRIRYADPGEFTRRAFYNERLDLTQVEALGDVLSAETEQQRRLAVSGSENTLGARYEEWRKMLLYARGELEALIDFSEDQHFDESPADFMASVTEQIVQLKRQVELHITNASKGELLRNGISLALLGAPNAGKSSLLNIIAGREAAIVSSEAGTTRDIVDVGVDIGGWLCRLGDTAGLRNDLSPTKLTPGSTIGAIEKEGIRRARARALQSDVVIAVLSIEVDPGTRQPFLHVDPEVASAISQCKDSGKAILIAVNKIDNLDHSSNTPSSSEILSTTTISSPSTGLLLALLQDISPSQIVPISCHHATSLTTPSEDPGNIQTLLQTLTSTFSALTTPSTSDPTSEVPDCDPSYWTHSLSVSHRQSTQLQQCLMHLNDFLTLAQPQTSQELHHVTHSDTLTTRDQEQDEIDIVAAAETLRSAAHRLARITGKSDTSDSGGAGDVEDVLGVVFEKFCVGK